MYFSRDSFIPQIGREGPQLLVCDAATSHVSVNTVRLSIQENIGILCLPAKTTAFLQPVDQLFAPLIQAFADIAYKCSYMKHDFLVKPANFPEILRQSMATAWTKELIESAFRRTGLKFCVIVQSIYFILLFEC